MAAQLCQCHSMQMSSSHISGRSGQLVLAQTGKNRFQQLFTCLL